MFSADRSGTWGTSFGRGARSALPVVLTRAEVKAILGNLTGDKWLMASLTYGAGLRLLE